MPKGSWRREGATIVVLAQGPVRGPIPRGITIRHAGEARATRRHPFDLVAVLARLPLVDRLERLRTQAKEERTDHQRAGGRPAIRMAPIVAKDPPTDTPTTS